MKSISEFKAKLDNSKFIKDRIEWEYVCMYATNR